MGLLGFLPVLKKSVKFPMIMIMFLPFQIHLVLNDGSIFISSSFPSTSVYFESLLFGNLRLKLFDGNLICCYGLRE